MAPASFMERGELTELTKKSGVSSEPGHRKLPPKNGTNPVFYGTGELTELTEKIRCKQWAGPPEAPCKKRNKSRALPSGREISLYIPPILEAPPFSRGAAISSMKMIIICRLNKR